MLIVGKELVISPLGREDSSTPSFHFETNSFLISRGSFLEPTKNFKKKITKEKEKK